MNQRVQTIVDEVRKLSREERDEVMRALASVADDDEAPEGTPAEIEAAWVQEVERRIAADQRGEVQWIPADQVMAELRAKYGKK